MKQLFWKKGLWLCVIVMPSSYCQDFLSLEQTHKIKSSTTGHVKLHNYIWQVIPCNNSLKSVHRALRNIAETKVVVQKHTCIPIFEKGCCPGSRVKHVILICSVSLLVISGKTVNTWRHYFPSPLSVLTFLSSMSGRRGWTIAPFLIHSNILCLLSADSAPSSTQDGK